MFLSYSITRHGQGCYETEIREAHRTLYYCLFTMLKKKIDIHRRRGGVMVSALDCGSSIQLHVRAGELRAYLLPGV